MLWWVWMRIVITITAIFYWVPTNSPITSISQLSSLRLKEFKNIPVSIEISLQNYNLGFLTVLYVVSSWISLLPHYCGSESSNSKYQLWEHLAGQVFVKQVYVQYGHGWQGGPRLKKWSFRALGCGWRFSQMTVEVDRDVGVSLPHAQRGNSQRQTFWDYPVVPLPNNLNIFFTCRKTRHCAVLFLWWMFRKLGGRRWSLEGAC